MSFPEPLSQSLVRQGNRVHMEYSVGNSAGLSDFDLKSFDFVLMFLKEHETPKSVCLK